MKKKVLQNTFLIGLLVASFRGKACESEANWKVTKSDANKTIVQDLRISGLITTERLTKKQVKSLLRVLRKLKDLGKTRKTLNKNPDISWGMLKITFASMKDGKWKIDWDRNLGKPTIYIYHQKSNASFLFDNLQEIRELTKLLTASVAE